MDTKTAALRAYEVGRARTSLLRAAVVSFVIALVGYVLHGRSTLGWTVLPFAVVFASEYRGLGLAIGVRRGVLVGLATLAVPLWLLRPCCDPVMMEMAARTGDMSCCTDWSCCLVIGLLLGVVSSFAMPRADRGSTHLTLFGFVAGAASVAALRCSMLFYGEALGLFGGLLTALVVASAARAFLPQRSRAA
jgi:hypothetical protein